MSLDKLYKVVYEDRKSSIPEAVLGKISVAVGCSYHNVISL